MIIRTIRRMMFAALVFLLVGGSIVICPVANANETVRGDSDEVTRLLKEARSQARALELDASKLETYNRSQVSWQSHAVKLTAVKNHVNALGKTLAELENRSPEASTWQQNAIKEMRPLLAGVADKTTQAIEHLRENPLRIDFQEYRETLADKGSLSSDLADLLNDHVEYGDAKERMAELEAKIGPGL